MQLPLGSEVVLLGDRLRLFRTDGRATDPRSPLVLMNPGPIPLRWRNGAQRASHCRITDSSLPFFDADRPALHASVKRRTVFPRSVSPSFLQDGRDNPSGAAAEAHQGDSADSSKDKAAQGSLPFGKRRRKSPVQEYPLACPFALWGVATSQKGLLPSDAWLAPSRGVRLLVRCLGPTNPWTTAVPTETFSTSTFKAASWMHLSFESSLLRPRSALGMAPPPLTRRLLRGTFGSSPRSAFPYTARVSTPVGCPRGNTEVVLLAPANFPDVYHRHRPFAEQVNYTGESLHVPSGVPTSMATIPASPFTYVLCG